MICGLKQKIANSQGMKFAGSFGTHQLKFLTKPLA